MLIHFFFLVIEKYWKKYQYASKFVQLVKSKTPKVTLYTKYAKVMLMENSPNADLEVCFYDGESNVYVETCDPTEGGALELRCNASYTRVVQERRPTRRQSWCEWWRRVGSRTR